MTPRCPWCGTDPLYLAYHDDEWGVPSHDDRHLFEMLILEGAQAGLSWITILRKREAYRAAFAEFDPVTVARFSQARVERLLQNPGIIRNRLKVEGTVRNARACLETQQAFGSFDRYIWQFVGGAPIVNRPKTLKDVPAQTAESDAMSHGLRARGFTFVGPTICYAFMQATGMVNDHLVGCFRYKQITTTKGTKKNTKTTK
ncbi:MAG: DNA-3-methyladenine glycosylase I [Vicinamibacteria bacterium]|nr:DNA-3-methyladenine glycosylase I [Vicinamibacteria bacterium]